MNAFVTPQDHIYRLEKIMESKVFLVTGATGDTGSKVTQFLLEKGYKGRAFVHKKDERSTKLADLGAEIVVGDLLDFQSVRGALGGVSGAYFVYPIAPGLIEATAFFAQSASEAHVGHIVNMSQISARREAKSHGAFNHWIAERVFDWSGLSVTHLRPTFFAEWFLYRDIKIGSQKEFFNGLVEMGFSKDGKHAPIAAEDQARVIVSILENPGPHAGKSYPLFGPREYTYPEAFAEISEILNRKIRYEEIPLKVWEERIANTRSPFLAQHLVEVAKDHAAGVFSGTNDVVKRITGKEPMGLREFVAKNKTFFETGGAAKVIE
jgi:NAD(P)H dehydrogenase (quinone)